MDDQTIRKLIVLDEQSSEKGIGREIRNIMLKEEPLNEEANFMVLIEPPSQPTNIKKESEDKLIEKRNLISEEKNKNMILSKAKQLTQKQQSDEGKTISKKPNEINSVQINFNQGNQPVQQPVQITFNQEVNPIKFNVSQQQANPIEKGKINKNYFF